MNKPLVLRNGRIVTMAVGRPLAESVLISGDRILALGNAQEATVWCEAGAQVVDLDGRTVIPGLIDAHAHMEREGLKELRLSLKGTRSVAEVLERIAAATRTLPNGEWVVTMPVGTPPYYFDGPTVLSEGRLPVRHELDSVAPDHPVYIMGPFGTWSRVPTKAALNTAALKRVGILDGAEARCGGVEFERDTAGRLTGIVVEHNERPTLEFDLLKSVPRFTWQQRLDALRRSMALYNSVGTTSVYEGHGSYATSVALYQRLWEEDALTVRVSLTLSPSWQDHEEARRIMRDWLGFARGRGLGDDRLRVAGVYVGFGGNACVAELSREHLPDTGWAGFVEWCNDVERYEALVGLAAEHDLRVHTVILENLGLVLPIFERIAERHPIADRRWVMEHVGQVSPEDHERIRRLGLVITTIPVYQLWKNGDDYFEAPNGGNEVAAHKSLMAAGVPVAIGTDNVPISLFKTMAVTRERRERTTDLLIGPDEQLDGTEALRTCTIYAARLSFEEDRKGSLEPGKLADMVVLPEDPTLVPPNRLEELTVHATMVGGSFVFENW